MSRAETRSGKPARKPAADSVADARAAEHLRLASARVWEVLSGVPVGSTYLARGSEEILVKLSDEVSCTARLHVRDSASIARALATWPTRFDYATRSPAIEHVLRSSDNPDLGVLRGGATRALAIFDRDSLRAYLAWTRFRVHNPNDILVCVLATSDSPALEG